MKESDWKVKKRYLEAKKNSGVKLKSVVRKAELSSMISSMTNTQIVDHIYHLEIKLGEHL